jgi:hypothetical protein
MKKDLSPTPATGRPLPRLPEVTTITKIVGAAVIGMLSFASAVLTTVVEQGGFWQYFWLGICILFFVCAMGLVILASKDGIRIDHNGLSFEPRDASSVAERKPGISQEQR